jgi:hypothetical protein
MLPKDIVVFIARGSCCYGHVIAIDKNGNLKYSVGTYSAPSPNGRNADPSLPEVFDLNRIKVDKKYAQKSKQLSADVLGRLAALVGDEDKLGFRDSSLVFDAYFFSVYLDNRIIAYGYDSNMKGFPAKLQELINLVTSQAELHQLPGMA